MGIIIRNMSGVQPFHANWLGHYLKIWPDRYPFLAEIKDSTMQIQSQKTIVTSNFKIEQIWTGSVFATINSRFEKIYIDEDNSLCVYKSESCEFYMLYKI